MRQIMQFNEDNKTVNIAARDISFHGSLVAVKARRPGPDGVRGCPSHFRIVKPYKITLLNGQTPQGSRIDHFTSRWVPSFFYSYLKDSFELLVEEAEKWLNRKFDKSWFRFNDAMQTRYAELIKQKVDHEIRLETLLGPSMILHPPTVSIVNDRIRVWSPLIEFPDFKRTITQPPDKSALEWNKRSPTIRIIGFVKDKIMRNVDKFIDFWRKIIGWFKRVGTKMMYVLTGRNDEAAKAVEEAPATHGIPIEAPKRTIDESHSESSLIDPEDRELFGETNWSSKYDDDREESFGDSEEEEDLEYEPPHSKELLLPAKEMGEVQMRLGQDVIDSMSPFAINALNLCFQEVKIKNVSIRNIIKRSKITIHRVYLDPMEPKVFHLRSNAVLLAARHASINFDIKLSSWIRSLLRLGGRALPDWFKVSSRQGMLNVDLRNVDFEATIKKLRDEGDHVNTWDWKLVVYNFRLISAYGKSVEGMSEFSKEFLNMALKEMLQYGVDKIMSVMKRRFSQVPDTFNRFFASELKKAKIITEDLGYLVVSPPKMIMDSHAIIFYSTGFEILPYGVVRDHSESRIDKADLSMRNRIRLFYRETILGLRSILSTIKTYLIRGRPETEINLSIQVKHFLRERNSSLKAALGKGIEAARGWARETKRSLRNIIFSRE